MPWHSLAPWRTDPQEALHELQVELLKKNYDLYAELQKHLHSAQEAVRLTESEGDPYGILHEYRRTLARLERIARRPFPADPEEQVSRLRQIYEATGMEFRDALDVIGVSDHRRIAPAGVSRRLAPRAMHELFGTATPSRFQAEASLQKIYETLSRGESVCFPVFSVNGRRPIGWYFVGYSIH